MKKFNSNFERDFKWFLAMRHTFNFDGSAEYWNKKGVNNIQYHPKGVTGKEAFYQWDTNGIINPTKHPNLLHTLLKVKGGCNLHIKLYAEDRAAHNLNFLEFRALCIHFKAPPWFRIAVENQKMNYWQIDNLKSTAWKNLT